MQKCKKWPKYPKIAKYPKMGFFREIPQNWDFGDYGGEHTRKAWCGNYFKNNPWIPILHTSIKGVYFILFVSYWFSVNFIFGYLIKVEENVIKWKKMVVDVQNEVFYRIIRLLNTLLGTLIIRLCGDFTGDFMEVEDFFVVLYRYIVIVCYL